MHEQYEKGLKFSKTAIFQFLDSIDPNWRSLGIFTFEEGEIIDTEEVFVSPEMLLLSVASILSRKNQNTLLIINSNKPHKYSISSENGKLIFDDSLNHFDFSQDSLFYFGSKLKENNIFESIPSLKIDLDWILDHKPFLAKVVEQSNLVNRNIKVNKLSDVFDIPELSKFFIKSLGPPSLSEDAVRKVQGITDDSIVSDLTTFNPITNPFGAAYKGIKYAYKLAKLRKERQQDEVQKQYSEWQENIDIGYSEEVLSDLFQSNGLEQLIHHMKNNKITIIINDTFGTPHELCLNLLLRNILDLWNKETNNEDLFCVLDNGSMYVRTQVFSDLIRPPPNSKVNLHFVSNFSTKNPSDEKILVETSKDYLRDLAIVFDISPKIFDQVFGNLSFSNKSFLQKQFEDVGKKTTKESIYYLTLDKSEKQQWKINKLKLRSMKTIFSSFKKDLEKKIISPIKKEIRSQKDKTEDEPQVETEKYHYSESELRRRYDADPSEFEKRQKELDEKIKEEKESEQNIKS
ncbi:MAG: hypothetical protein ACTSUV_01750 [Candidatus Ranarchaeia archaeon]